MGRIASRTRALARWIAPAGLASLASCGGPRGGADAPVGAPGGAGDELAVTTPASWIYHPREEPAPAAALPLGDGRCVVATLEGERWLVPARDDGRCAGVSLGAATGAPEPLRRVVRDGGTFRFVGESGALYEAREPLGPFTAVVVPPEPLGRVASRGAVTIGLASRGTPYVLGDDGWVRGDAGGARLFDVEVATGGRALAIAWPESVLASSDGGRTFRPIAPPPAPIGAIAVTGGDAGPLEVAGVHGRLAWTATGLAPAARTTARDDDAAPAEVRPVPLAPSAASLTQGRASLAGRRWYEVRPAADVPGSPDEEEPREGRRAEASGWVLVRGRVGGALATLPLEGLDEDREVRLAAHGRTLVVATIADPVPGDRGARLLVRRSLDEGATFVEVGRVVAPDVRAVRLAVSPRGDVLVTGACVPGRPSSAPDRRGRQDEDEDDDDDDGPCSARAPVLLRPGDRPPASTAIVVGVAPDLRGAASSPAFSPDGAIAYVLGRRAKGQEPSVFVSDDGARTWDSRPLRRRGGVSLGVEDAGLHDHHDAWEDEDRHDEPGGAIELLPELPLTVDGEGTLGFAVQTPSAQAWVVADVDGEVRSVSDAPATDALVAGIGRRALAVATTGEALATWETTDGGAAWHPAGTMRARVEGDLAVACSAAGCVVGDALTRVGWEAQDELTVVAPPPAAARAPAVRTPLVCEPDPKGWGALPSIELTAPFPGLDEIARGRAAWSVLGVDRERGAATVHHVPLDGDGRVVARALLEPAKGRAAMRLSHQGEGYAVARWVDGAGDLDVAWINFFDGLLGQRSVALPAGTTPRVTTQGGARDLETGLVSVATGGLLVQAAPASRQAAFLDARNGTTTVTLPDWGAAGVSGRVRTDHARIGGRSVFVGLIDAGPTVGLLGVRPEGGELTVEATTLAPPAPRGGPAAASTAWTYVGGAPGFVVVAGDPSGEPWSAAVYRAFGADGRLGPPVAAPTLVDLPDRPRPCRADEIRSTPRIESHLVAPGAGVPLARGERHPVIVTGAGEGSSPDGALHLLTAGAVLHGTPDSPCVAGWEATGIDGRRAAAVILGDLGRAWAFRLAPTPPGAASRPAASGAVDVEVRAMACRWDPSVAPPDGVWDETGVR